MNKREKTIAVVTGLVFLMWIRNFMGGSPEKPAKPVRSTRPASRGRARPSSKEPDEKPQAITFDWRSVIEYGDLKGEDNESGPIRDPFEKLDYASVFNTAALEFSELTLTGIIWERADPVALINTQVLRTGEMISGFKVEEIRQNEVVLVKGTERYVLRLYTQSADE